MSELYNDLIAQVVTRKQAVEAERAELRARDDQLKNEQYRIQRIERLLSSDTTSPKVRDAKRKRASRGSAKKTTSGRRHISEASALRELAPVFERFGDGTHFTIPQLATSKTERGRLDKAIGWGRDQGYLRLIGREGGKRGGGSNLFQVVAVPQAEGVLHAVH